MRVYLNGQLLPLEEARVPVLDRGFIFGDGVYEVIPVYDRRPFRLDHHLGRLQQSLDGIRLANPLDGARWHEVIHQLMAEAPWPDQGMYIQVTRGPAPREHAFPAEVRPTVFIMASELTGPPARLREQGIDAILLPDQRWLRCDLKTTSLLANVLARQAAVDHGAGEALLVRDGYVIEGAASSVFMVRNGVLTGPPDSHLMLPGITCELVRELALQHGLPLAIRELPLDEVRAADELMITSSTREILPVTRLDGQAVANGRPGPVFRRLFALYQDFKTRVMRGGEA